MSIPSRVRKIYDTRLNKNFQGPLFQKGKSMNEWLQTVAPAISSLIGKGVGGALRFSLIIYFFHNDKFNIEKLFYLMYLIEELIIRTNYLTNLNSRPNVGCRNVSVLTQKLYYPHSPLDHFKSHIHSTCSLS